MDTIFAREAKTIHDLRKILRKPGIGEWDFPEIFKRLEDQLRVADQITRMLCEIDWCIGYDIYTDSKNAELLQDAIDLANKQIVKPPV